jgi:Zn-dependent M16 (insulinase) family peptidase
MKTRIKIAFLMVSIGLSVYFAASIIESVTEYNNAVIEEDIAKQELNVAIQERETAEKNLAYEYGKCVFYDRVPLEECNSAGPDGLRVYEKYYGDGSWTVKADPLVE